jgi:hypothetical protein
MFHSSLEKQVNWKIWLLCALFSLFLGVLAAVSPWLAVGLLGSAAGLLAILRAKTHYLMWLLAFTLAFQFEYELASIRFNWTELLALLLTCILISRSLVENDSTWLRLPHKGLFAVFLICGLIAQILGPGIESIAQGTWHLYKVVLAMPLLYFVAFVSIRSKRVLKTAVAILVISFTISSGVGIIQTLSGGRYLTGLGVYGNLRYLGIFPPFPSEVQEIMKNFVGTVSDLTHVPNTAIFRAHGGFTNHNYFAVGLVMTLSITTSLWLYAQSSKRKLLLGVATIVQLLALILTFSRGGWVGFALSVTVIVLLVRKKPGYLLVLKTMIIGGIGISLVIIAMLMLPTPLATRATSILNPAEATEMQGRFEAWSTSLQEIQKHPVWGTGTSEVAGVTMFGHNVTSHNIFLSIAYERGLIALVAFIFLLAVLARDSLRLVGKRKNDDLYLQGLGLGLLSGVTGFLAAGMLASPILYPESAALFWFTAGLLEAAVRIRKES